MKNSRGQSRRDFLKESLATLGVASLSTLPTKAQADATPRHHLINIVRKGGWDALWFHNGIAQNEFKGLIETNRPIVNGQAFINGSGNILAPFSNDFALKANNTWSVRYPDSYLGYHPDGVNTVGPGLNFMTAADFAQICIWRGVASQGGHNLGNQILQTGGLSGSLPSFSAAIAAQSISNGVVRKLHYTQLSDNSVQLNTQGGTYGQLVQPINIPNLSSWQNLTSPAANQLSTQNRRNYLNNAISSLSSGTTTGVPFMDSTKDVFTSFLNSFLGGSSILNSNYATSADFTSTVQYYQTGITGILNNHIFKTTWFNSSGADDLVANGVVGTMAFRFALAEFLVKNDLSTVIDILVPGGGDFHNNANNDALSHLCLFAAYVLLVRRLKGTESAAGTGISLLDLTTVAMHTEFERHPQLSALDEAHRSTPGADHWPPAASIWLAGKGVNVGKVIGDFKRDNVGSKYATADFKNFGGYYPLPLDPVTGQVKPNGVIPGIECLNPTMLTIFGAMSFSKVNGIYPFMPVTKV